MKNDRKLSLRRKVLGVGLALSLATALAACGGGGGGPSPTQTDQIITAWPADATTLDPQNAAGSQDWELAFNLYERLISPKWTPTESGALAWTGTDIEPQLAESFDLDGDTATFKLRQDVKFYPSGNPLTADDVIYTLQRSFDIKKAGALNGGGIQDMSQVTKVDDHTVSIKFTDYDGKPITATPTLLQVLREPQYGIFDSVEVAKHVTASDPAASEWLKENSAGTGPYFIKKRTAGQEFQLAAVPDGDSAVTPHYKNVTIRIVNGGSVASLLKGGDINLGVYGLTQADISNLSDNDDFVVHQVKAPEFSLLELATDAGPLADQAVRQAIGYTIPYDEIAQSVYFGRAKRVDSYVTPDGHGYSPAWKDYVTDLDKAKTLLGAKKVSVPLHYNGSDPEMEDLAILIKSSAAKAGISFELQPELPADFQNLITSRATDGKGPADALLIKWGSWIDDAATPVDYYTTTNGVNNYPMWSDPTVDKIAKAENFSEISDDRAKAYAEAQAIVAQAAPMFPIVRADRNIVVAKGITGASVSPEMGLRYWTLTPDK